MKTLPIIAVVTRDTRLENLKERWVTTSNVKFRMQQAASHEHERLLKRAQETQGTSSKANDELAFLAAAEALSDDDELQEEAQIYTHTLRELMIELDIGYPIKEIDRDYVANFDFQRCVVVVVFGQDGLVANVAKYVGDVPIIGVNPDPARNDGILLPFAIQQVRSIVHQAVEQKVKTREVTLAEVTTNDGQQMLAFNDFFLGCKSHTSARYTLELNLQTESQSSSGLIVSTGAGSTGWMSSLFNMAERLGKTIGGEQPENAAERPQLKWEDDNLIWAVREPFISRHSSAEFVGGVLHAQEELVVGSQMDGNGVIFSDGIENDFIEFNSGSIAAFRVAKQKAYLVTG